MTTHLHTLPNIMPNKMAGSNIATKVQPAIGIMIGILVVLTPLSAKAAITLVNDSTPSVTNTVTVTAPTQGNTMICVAASVKGSVESVTSISQTNVTYTRAAQSSANFPWTEVWYGTVGAGAGTTVTVNWSNGTADYATACAEFSGIDSVSPVDGTPGTSSGSSDPANTPAYSNANSNDIIFAIAAFRYKSAVTGPTGFTELNSVAGGNGTTQRGIDWGYNVVSATGPQSSSWSGSGANFWSIALLGLKEQAVSSVQVIRRQMRLGGFLKFRGYVRFK